ncbi:MAG: hypothetical protein NVS1B11_03600 [Terriglobales bacterium]
MRPTLLLFLAFLGSLLVAAQTDIIPLASEPHHHLALHNSYVNVYKVEVASHDAVKLHRHDFDAISVMLAGAEVTVSSPGKPAVHSRLGAGQVRLQYRGYVHSTTVNSDATYRNVTVELLAPQEGEHNLCAAVIAGQPLDCPNAVASGNQPFSSQPQFASDKTTVDAIILSSRGETRIADPRHAQLIVTLDDLLTAVEDRQDGKIKRLHSGDFIWLDGNGKESIKNEGREESHFVLFKFQPRKPAETSSATE